MPFSRTLIQALCMYFVFVAATRLAMENTVKMYTCTRLQHLVSRQTVVSWAHLRRSSRGYKMAQVLG